MIEEGPLPEVYLSLNSELCTDIIRVATRHVPPTFGNCAAKVQEDS